MAQHNFGYETVGGSTAWLGGRIRGSVFTITEEGTADSITVSLYNGGSAWTGKLKCAIYLHSDLNLKGATEERTIALTGTLTWYTFNFATPKPSLTANTAYILVVWAEMGNGNVKVAYSGGDANQGHYQLISYTGNFPNPLVPTHDNNKYSIYCTYTVGGAPPAGGILAQVI